MSKRIKGAIGLNNVMGYMNLGCLFGIGYCWGAKDGAGAWSLVGVMVVVTIYHFLYEVVKEHQELVDQYKAEKAKNERKAGRQRNKL